MSSPLLDQDFDFRVNSAGDIALERGVADIEKDLSVIAATVLDRRASGVVLDGTARLQLESIVASAVQEHELVSTVPDVSIQSNASGDITGTITAVVDGTEITTTV